MAANRWNLSHWFVPALLVLLVGAGLTLAFWPRPLEVDMAVAERTTLAVTVRGDGETRVREVFLVSSPIAGELLRIDADVGDPVVAGETLLADIRPEVPAFLNLRTRSERQAALHAAEAALSLAEAEVERDQAELEFAQVEFKRAQELSARGNISVSRLDQARTNVRTRQAALSTTAAALRVREFELQNAQAALMNPDQAISGAGGEEGSASQCCFPILAPITGQILRVIQESATVVQSGTPLIELGDPADLEIVVDYLSADAVRISPGDRVLIDRWGGPGVLPGTVRRIEPYGFTKTSALGIDEQRVNVIIDFAVERAVWERLGHGYRVEAAVILWEAQDALTVPLGALFRQGQDWAVYAVESGKASLRTLRLGRRNDEQAQVLEGLEEGEQVVLYPSDRVSEGVGVVEREG